MLAEGYTLGRFDRLALGIEGFLKENPEILRAARYKPSKRHYRGWLWDELDEKNERFKRKFDGKDKKR